MAGHWKQQDEELHRGEPIPLDEMSMEPRSGTHFVPLRVKAEAADDVEDDLDWGDMDWQQQSAEEVDYERFVREKKKIRSRHRPRRPMSAFMLFAGETRQSIKQDNPTATFGQIGKLLGASWKELPDGKKAEYQAMSLAAKERLAPPLPISLASLKADAIRYQIALELAIKTEPKCKSHRIFYWHGRFIGKWQGRRLNEYGVAIYLTGERYEGEWQNGERHGWGIMWWPRRIIVDGMEQGDGPNAWERYEGNWMSDERSGEGTKFGRKGKVCVAIWEKDMVKTVKEKRHPNKAPMEDDGQDNAKV